MHNPRTNGASRRTVVRAILLACPLFIVTTWYAVTYSVRARQGVFRGFVAGLEDHGARLSGVNPLERTIAVVDLTTSQFSELTLEAYLKKCDVWRIERLILGISYSKGVVVRLRRDFNVGIVEERTSVTRSDTEKEPAAGETRSRAALGDAGKSSAEKQRL
jgi:hypothetical protein